jgi:hypothetical protein
MARLHLFVQKTCPAVYELLGRVSRENLRIGVCDEYLVVTAPNYDGSGDVVEEQLVERILTVNRRFRRGGQLARD